MEELDDYDSYNDYDDGDYSKLVQLSAEVMDRLRENDPELTRLEINWGHTAIYNGNNIDWEKEGKYISDSRYLKSLHIYEYGLKSISNENVKALYRSLSLNRSIECLHLDNTTIGYRNMIEIVMPFFKDNNNLHYLELINVGDTYLDLDKRSAQLLVSALSSFVSLRRFEMYCSSDVDNVSAGEIVTSLGVHKNLGKLILCVNNNGEQWCTELSKLLQDPASKLEVLDLHYSKINDEGATVLADAFRTNRKLRKLYLNELGPITSFGWITLTSGISECSSLEEIDLSDNFDIDDEEDETENKRGFDDEAARVLANMFSVNTSIQVLNLTSTEIGEAGIIAVVNALAMNSTLKKLDLSYQSITRDGGWGALANVLCNKSSIKSIYTSNHILEGLGEYEKWNPSQVPCDIHAYLELNKNEDKAEVVRQKIIKYHFNDGESNIQKFVNMELNELPQVISWTGRNDIGLSLLYKLCRSMPALFDSDSKAKAGAKQKATWREDLGTV